MELDNIEQDPMKSSPLVDYVNFRLKQTMEVDGEMSETLEVDLLRVDLEASTDMRADTVDMLCEKLKLVELMQF